MSTALEGLEHRLQESLGVSVIGLAPIIRALTIAVFYAIGTGVGGVIAPVLLGFLIQTGSRAGVAAGWGLGALLMVIAGTLALAFGVDAERKSLEDIAGPMRDSPAETDNESS